VGTHRSTQTIDNKGAVLTDPTWLQADLLERIRIEFGERAFEFLQTAHGLLNSGLQVPRLGETVAYCLREVFQEILVSRWTLSADWENLPAGGSNTEETDDRDPEQKANWPATKMTQVMVDLTGGVPLPGQVELFIQLRKEANERLHSDLSFLEARRLWSRCLAVLERLFMPPERRMGEIEALAGVESPCSDDRDALVGLFRGPDHVRFFFSKVKTPAWLALLDDSELAGPFRDMNLLGWPALSVVERLAPDYPDEVERWLLDMYDRHVKKVIGLERSKKAVRAHRLALVAFHADRPMLGIVLQALKDFRSSWDVVVLGVSAVRKTPPPDGMVAAFADVLLSESCWKAWPHSESVVKSVVDGLNDSNAIERIELLCQKIQATSDTASQSLFEQHRRGSVLDIIGDPPYRDRLFVLVKGLTEAISRATEWVATSDLLNVLEGKSFPPGLASRLRAWMLSKCSDTEHDQMIGEIEEAIRSGRPTRDHLALVDRVVAQCHPSLYTARWGEALGPAPDVGEVERVLAEDGFPAEEWFRVWRWASLLPGDAVGDWSPVGEALESKWGRTDRAWYEYRPTKARSVTSPIPAEQLKAVHPWEAARQIAEWRAQPDEWPWTHIGPAKLGLTLEAVVKENPEQWTADPLQIARLLRHPTYVKHYLRAVADVTSVTMPISGLLDVISHVRTHPGEVIVLGEKKSGYDPDWTRAEAEAVELIQALARIDVDFSDRKEEIWAFLETQTAKCRPENSTRDTQLDAYERAINRPCTRALDAVIHLIANEYRRSGTVSPAAVPIFETGLRLPGNNGKEHRAILASQIGFIRHVLPEWTENNLDLFFRDHAPEGLGQRTFEMVIKWGQPHWMLKR